jgi:hypothetical protein
MEFEKQKPTSDEYKKNWDMVFGIPKNDNVYPNGCPVLDAEYPIHSTLEHRPERDDL